MAKQTINTGTSANSRNGDSIRSAFNKVNANFTELYDTLVSITTSAQVNADWDATSGMAQILNKPFIPDSQVHSDWNAVAGLAQILNKPTIPAAQIQSDWAQTNNTSTDFIKNKPSIPSISGLATETYVDSAVSSLVDSAPETLNTLSELAAALNDDTSFATTLTTLVGTKVSTSDLTWTNVTGKPTFALVASTNSYNSLDDTPALFSGAYADLSGKPALFSGLYDDLAGKPTIPTNNNQLTNGEGYITSSALSGYALTTSIPTNNNQLTNGAQYITSSSLTWSNIISKPTFATVATTNNYSDLDGKPALFSGAYADLSGKPTLFSGAYADLSGKPTLFSGSYNDLTNKPSIPSLTGYATESYVGTYVGTAISNLVDTAPTTLDTLNELAAALGDDPNFATTITTAIGNKANTSSLATVATSGSYNDLTSKPTLFSGSYNDLTSKPSLFDGAYSSLSGKPTLFDGAYSSLSGKPTLSTVATSGSYSDLTNKPDFKEILYLNELLDVNTSGFQENGTGPVYPAPITNNVLKYNGTGRWIAGTVSYNDLTDKPSTSAFTGDITFLGTEIRYEAVGNIKIATDAVGNSRRAWTFYGDGALELPTSNLGVGTIQSVAGIWLNANGVLWQFNSNGAVDFPSVNGTTSLIRSTGHTTLNSNGKEWMFKTDGNLTLPAGGDILDSTGTSVLGTSGSTDRIVNGVNEVVLGADGSLQLPGTGVSDYQYNAAQEITVLAGAVPTVVFTSVNNSVESIKAIIKVSVAQAPADGFNVVDSQICEMLITSKSSVPVGGGTMVRTAVATVYGVTHTSATPLATFTVNYFNNPVGPSVIQILAQPTAAVTGTDMVVTTVATELANYF